MNSSIDSKLLYHQPKLMIGKSDTDYKDNDGQYIPSHNPLPVPSWDGIRGIYKKLSDEFHVLTRAFDIELDANTSMYLDHLIIAIDEIDTCIDELPTRAERDDITDSLITFLMDGSECWSHSNGSQELPAKIINLKQVVHKLDITSSFVSAAKTIFDNTELKRHAIEHDVLIRNIITEGQATAVLPLSIMGLGKDTPYGIFFTKLCMLMGIADLIVDARDDYRQGLIALKPNTKLYFKLVGITVKDGIKLLWCIPRKFQFLKYCVRMIVSLIKG